MSALPSTDRFFGPGSLSVALVSATRGSWHAVGTIFDAQVCLYPTQGTFYEAAASVSSLEIDVGLTSRAAMTALYAGSLSTKRIDEELLTLSDLEELLNRHPVPAHRHGVSVRLSAITNRKGELVDLICNDWRPSAPQAVLGASGAMIGVTIRGVLDPRKTCVSLQPPMLQALIPTMRAGRARGVALPNADNLRVADNQHLNVRLLQDSASLRR